MKDQDFVPRMNGNVKKFLVGDVELIVLKTNNAFLFLFIQSFKVEMKP